MGEIVEVKQDNAFPADLILIDSDMRPDENSDIVSFNLRPGKVHLFDAETEMVID